jgi:hypothetical protein
MRIFSKTRAIPVCFATAVMIGCSDARDVANPGTDQRAVAKELVTGRALAALDANGRFAIPSRSGWHRTLLTEREAAAFGVVYARRIAAANASFYERTRGARIAFDSLQECGRAFLAESPYEEPDATMPEGLVNAIAPRWMVSFCEDGESPSLSVAVAATAGHLVIKGWAFDPSSLRGSEFMALGVPVGRTLTPGPEFAVTHLATASGKRVEDVPELLLMGLPWEPQAARWLLKSEATVRVRRADGSESDHATLFVGREPNGLGIRTYEGSSGRATDPPETVLAADGTRHVLRRRVDMPRRFVAVEVAK